MDSSSRAQIVRDTVDFVSKSVEDGTQMGLRFADSRENTKLFKEEDTVTLIQRPQRELPPTTVEVTREDTLVAAKRLMDEGYGQPCILNFANAFEPGGPFLKGCKTQEDRLVRCTSLQWCLKDQPNYKRNSEYKGSRSLFLHDLLYSPDVLVLRDLDTEARLDDASTYPLSIVTCPAPLASLAQIYGENKKILSTLDERIRRILAVMANNKHNGVVLGAFGCGAFSNDPDLVAAIFRKWMFGEYQGYFRKVVFAICEQEGCSNITAFEKALL